ncbi:MAG: OmpH family outer membrane protein [Thiotrichales bacterium]|nr:OmpH family outer membrane protein [Thiotrichales bacterium]MCY4285799.1 OmpH family outer membrane protein [Thiotrichales bacterium]MCY4349288.1 OmpH family outer membrane protein [Thiotrichales bacterium]
MPENHNIRRLIHGWLMGLLLACGPGAYAQEFKVGFVNVAVVLDQAPQAAAARARIEREFAPRDREILSQQQELRALEDTLVKDVAVLSASERERQEAEIRQLKRELRRSEEEFREDLNLRRSQELSALQRMVTEVIQDMARAESYDLIMTDGVVFAGDKADITKRVIDRLKADFNESDG